MKLVIEDLKCNKCGHYEKLPYEQYAMNINKPCPICGDNLLTYKEYLACEKMMKTVNIYNRINDILKWFNPFFYLKLLILNGKKDKEHTIKLK